MLKDVDLKDFVQILRFLLSELLISFWFMLSVFFLDLALLTMGLVTIIYIVLVSLTANEIYKILGRYR